MYYLYFFLPISMLITLRLGYEFLVILPIHRTVRTYRHQSFQVAHRRWQIRRWRIGSWTNLKSACTYILFGLAYRYKKCCKYLTISRTYHCKNSCTACRWASCCQILVLDRLKRHYLTLNPEFGGNLVYRRSPTTWISFAADARRAPGRWALIRESARVGLCALRHGRLRSKRCINLCILYIYTLWLTLGGPEHEFIVTILFLHS